MVNKEIKDYLDQLETFCEKLLQDTKKELKSSGIKQENERVGDLCKIMNFRLRSLGLIKQFPDQVHVIKAFIDAMDKIWRDAMEIGWLKQRYTEITLPEDFGKL